MARLTEEQRVFTVEEMMKTGSLVGTRRKLKRKFDIEVSRQTIHALVKKWKQHGTIKNLHKDNSGRRKSVRTEESIDGIKSRLAISDYSIRKLSAATNVSVGSLHTILKKDLQLTPYKIQVSQELKTGDVKKRLSFCMKIKQMIEREELDPADIIFSDESHVHLNSSPNKQNSRLWRTKKPEIRVQVPLHSEKVTVWCGMNGTKVFGPFYFEDPETGDAETVTKERYTDMLIQMFPDNSDEIDSRSVFQQDGAPAHTSRMSMDWLKNRFPDKLISNKSDFVWPPRSPDLNPLDFFLLGGYETEDP